MQPRLVALLLMTSAAFPITLAAESAPAPFPVKIRVDAARSEGKYLPIWHFFGYDEANYATAAQGDQLLSELGDLEYFSHVPVYIRCHHLLTSGNGVPALKWSSTGVYSENRAGQGEYNWKILDGIFDAYVAHGLHPYVEIGFMPKALSIRPDLYPENPAPGQRVPVDAGQAYPPKSYARWSELVYQWALHSLEHYGAKEVSQWYWEVWNEPNISYWKGTREDYFKLYDYAVDGVRRALPHARVGGPETAGGAGGSFLGDFLQHCAHGENFATGGTGAPLDFISFHAKGRATWDGHIVMGLANQYRDIDRAFSVIASSPQFRHLPVVIGECDPEGCAACRGPEDGYRTGPLYASFTAASFGHLSELAASHGINLQGALTWAFEFEDQPPFAGYRVLSTDGIDLPILNLFRLYARLGGATSERLPVASDHGVTAAAIAAAGIRAGPDVSALACRTLNQVAVLVWHYADQDVPGPDAQVTVNVTGLPNRAPDATARLFRVDAAHSNPYALWKRMGSPATLTDAQKNALRDAGHLELPVRVPVREGADGTRTVSFTLPRQGVALIVEAAP